MATACSLDHHGVDPKPRLWISIPVIRLDAFRTETVRPVSLLQSGGEGPDAIDAEWFVVLVWWRSLWWSVVVMPVVAALSLIVTVVALPFVVAVTLLIIFPFSASVVDYVSCVS